MALNFEAAQAMVGEAIINQGFARTLTRDRGRALRALATAPCIPHGARLTNEDRLVLGSIRASSVQQFARAVERLCGDVRPLPATRPAAAVPNELALMAAARGTGSRGHGRAATHAPRSAG
jgi:hypothetical protein